MTRTEESKPDRLGANADDRSRVVGIYSRYARSARKRRAWAGDNPGNIAIRAELLAEIERVGEAELERDGEILDLGCGTGWCLRALAERGVEVERLVGLDLLPDRVEAARQGTPGARVEVGNARRLPFEDERFSLILMLTLLSSLGSSPAISEALGEARRALAPGGLLLCYEPRIANPLNRETRLIRDRDLATAGLVPHSQSTLTVLPWLARRLGGKTDVRYERLSRIGVLRTHRLIAYRSAPRSADQL